MSDEKTTVEEGPRDLNVLLGLDYSDMTSEEIELVVNFRAEVRARDAAFLEEHEQRLAYMATVTAKWVEAADSAKAEFDRQVQAASDRLDKSFELVDRIREVGHGEDA